MTNLVKQHLIDPEICIRCHACEAACTVGAIEHDERNVVVKAQMCNACMDCIPVCPTGSIDNWRFVETPYSLDDQYLWDDLPKQQELAAAESALDLSTEALDPGVAALLAEAHRGGGGRSRAPSTASKPTVNLYSPARPAEAVVQGNYRLTAGGADSEVRHIILDFGAQPMPVLEGQSLGILPPGHDAAGRAHPPRLYSVSSPRDGERPNFNNVALTVKRDAGGVCSNYLCDLKLGEKVSVAGPFGATFLMPNDARAKLLMICTGTGAAPFRAFTMRRQRSDPTAEDAMTLIFGARAPDSLPYFGPLGKIPQAQLRKHFAFSRMEGAPRVYVQDKLRERQDEIAPLLTDPNAYIYVCGRREMERGVDEALGNIAESVGMQWRAIRDAMREEGRYHVETY